MECSTIPKPMQSFPSIRLLSSLRLLDTERLQLRNSDAKIRTILKLSMIIRVFKVSMLISTRLNSGLRFLCRYSLLLGLQVHVKSYGIVKVANLNFRDSLRDLLFLWG